MVQTVVIVGIAALIGILLYSFAAGEMLPGVVDHVKTLLAI
jgi:hypothetical protein